MDHPVSQVAENATPRFEYFRGYPARFAGERRTAIRWTLSFIGPLFLLALFGSICAAYAVSVFRGGKGSLLLCGLLGLAAYFGLILVLGLRVAAQTTIVPYFQKPLGDIHTFAQGHAVARSCQALDGLAAGLGLTPLSAFGFNDDLAGETVNWHPPAQGLATISGLLAALRDHPETIPRQDRLIKELTAIEHALQKAVACDVPFCLLLRTADVTSSLEWERRQGTCF